MANLSIKKALGMAFQSMQLNFDVLKKVYFLIFSISFAIAIVNWLSNQMNPLGQIFASLILVILVLLSFILTLAYEWNIIYFGIKNKNFKLKQPFLWKDLGKFLIVDFLMSLLILFVFFLPSFIVLFGFGYLLFILLKDPIFAILFFMLLFILFIWYMRVKFFFVIFIIADRIIKKQKIKYWQIIKESFSLSKGYFWKIFGLFVLVDLISLLVGIIFQFIQLSFRFLIPMKYVIIESVIDSLFGPIISIIVLILSFVPAIYFYKVIKGNKKKVVD